MRTTVAIDDNILRSAKQQASRLGLTLGQFLEEALRRELAHRAERSSGPAVPIFQGGTGVRAGVDVTSTRALLEALDEGRKLEQMR